jgi:hypothetical protein
MPEPETQPADQPALAPQSQPNQVAPSDPTKIVTTEAKPENQGTPVVTEADLGVYAESEKKLVPAVPKGWNTATIATEPYGRGFKVLQSETTFGLSPEELLQQWHTSWNRDPAADRGAIKLPTVPEDGELAFSIVLQQAGKPVCLVIQQAFIPGVFTVAGVFDAEERISTIFKTTALRALFDQLRTHLKKAFPEAPRRRPRRDDVVIPRPPEELEVVNELPPGE